MDNVNKIISFVLGLIVVIVILLLITGRLGLLKGVKLFTARGNTATSKTPTPKKVTPTSRKLAQNTAQTPQQLTNNSETTSNSGTIKTIPSTGASTDILILCSIIFVGGIYLRKIQV